MGKKVLIAEDFDDVRHMMKIALELNGYETLEARDGSEAVESALHDHPDLILMDMSMPVLDGIGAIKAIREFDDDAANVPIVALTSDAEFYKERARIAGCTVMVQKPIFIDELTPLIERMLDASPVEVRPPR